MLADHIGISKLRDMASKGERLLVDVRLTDLPRISVLLYPEIDVSDEPISLRFDFRRSTQGLPIINGSASGFIDLQCQRCLGLLRWPIDLAFSLTVAVSQADLARSSEPFDTVLASDGSISLLELTEDELLASLPLAPMHDSLAACNLQDLLDRGAGNSLDELLVGDIQPAPAERADEIRRPFAGLSLLLKQKADPEAGNKS
jgi:uncharacterized metal-binding protein YceD (DUF177 family)